LDNPQKWCAAINQMDVEVSVVARDNSGGEATTKVVLRFGGTSKVN
jgi:hypothetical protein